MKLFKISALILFTMVSELAFAGGADLRRGQRHINPMCRTVTTGTALEFYEVATSTNIRIDQKEIWIQSMDVAYSTNSVRISSFPATADGEGYPVVGFAFPHKFFADSNVKVFIRRSTGQPSTEVCLGSLQ